MYSNKNVTDLNRIAKGQFFLQPWAAEILFDAHFSHLTTDDLLWEPTAGIGNMIAAVPSHIPVIGTEIDPELAEYARQVTGREVITADALMVDLPKRPTAIFGNPPWEYKFFACLMNRASGLLEQGKKAVFLIPAYFLQTSRTLNTLYKKKWTISQEIVPRDLFPGLSKPVVVASFLRENNARLIGFRLFQEVSEIRELTEEAQEMIANKVNGPRSTWREIIRAALSEIGGIATLNDIYKKMESRRPSENPFWKEKIRQQLQLSFIRHNDGRWSTN